jgi:hypothetical protein
MEADFEQLGGFSKVEFFLLEETDNWPIVLNDETATQITHIVSEINNFGIIAESSIDINISPKQTAEGLPYPTEIIFSFSNRIKELENYLDRYQNKPVVVIAELNTGQKKLYGTNETPLILIYKIDDGKKVEDLGVISVNIKGETRNRAVYYKV